jgi:DNA polymerase I-like protein with 3'-5' exonuclease and polymerase domains
MGSEATSRLLSQALSDQIAKTGNQLRNYRIQAGVADIVGIAMGRLYEMCKTYPSLVWVQSVHDSIVGETDADLGVEVATLQKQIMEDSMAEVCSGVPAKVDAEVCSNLGESGIITHV